MIEYKSLFARLTIFAGMFFASAAGIAGDAAASDSAGGAPAVDTGDAADTGDAGDAGDTGDVADADAGDADADQADAVAGDEADAGDEGKDAENLDEWKGSAAARLREICKLAPGLEQFLTKFPKVRDTIAASFRRDAALRDRNVTIAEIDEYRGRCPNGMQDLEAMERSVEEANHLDQSFFSRDREGNYPGHADFVRNLFDQDRNATIALLKRTPRDWAQADPESYSDTMGAIMASTFKRDQVLDRVARMHAAAKEAGDTALQNELADHYRYLESFGRRERSADPEAERLRRQLSERDRNDQERSQRDNQQFHDSLAQSAVANHRAIVNGHDLIKKLPQSISKEKRARIVDDITRRIEAHLQKSFSFRRDIEEAYVSRDTRRWHEVDRKGWQPWLVSLYVRKVLNEETPGIIQGNRTSNDKKRAAAARTGIANRRPTVNGAPASKQPQREYTTLEILSGQAPEAVVDAMLAKQRSR